MLSARFDTKQLNATLKNAISYSQGFIDGVNMEKLEFNRFLGGFTAEALNKFIDSKARMNPEMLHHVYEPGNVGNEGARLFKFEVKSTSNNISFDGSFLPSDGIPLNGGTPFVDRASIMENSISITITPKASSVLEFEDDGVPVFTMNSITIAHPGGDEVAGSFGRTVEEFFDVYFKQALLQPLLNDLSRAEEFTNDFAAGSKSGRPIGVKAGRKYLKVSGLMFE